MVRRAEFGHDICLSQLDHPIGSETVMGNGTAIRAAPTVSEPIQASPA